MSAPKYPSTLAPPGVPERNVLSILPALSPLLSSPAHVRLLELASGRGVHISAYAQKFPNLRILQPTETDAFMAGETDRWVAERGLQGRVRGARVLDVIQDGEGAWEDLREEQGWDLCVATNLLHLVPFPTAPENIFARLRPLMAPHGVLAIYGPFKTDAGFLSASDEKFDASLRQRRPGGEAFGLRNRDEVVRIAERHGWILKERIDMPMGNVILVFGLVGGENGSRAKL